MKKLTLILLAIFCHSAYSEKISVKPKDCGPLDRNEFGVVFSVEYHNKLQTYFSKGNALEVCPKILSASEVIGFEYPYCESHTPISPDDCDAVKVFVITGYQDNG